MTIDRDRTYQAAQKFLQKGQLDRAIAEYESLVQDDPSDLRALLKVGDLQLRLGNAEAATQAYRQVAQSYAQDGFFLKAVAVYKQMYNVEPDNVTVNAELAELYGRLNLVGEATAQYRSLAALHARAGAWADSLAAIERVRAAGDASDDVVLHWAEMVTKLGDAPAAQRELARLAQAHRDAGRMESWARLSERMLSMDEALSGLASTLAKHYMEQGDAHAALIKLRIAFQAAPQDDEILGLLARAFEALGQTSKATAVLRELEQQAMQRGQVQVRLGVLKQIVRLNPADADAEAAVARLEDEMRARRTGRGTVRSAPPPNGSEVGAAGIAAADVTKLLAEATVFARYGLHQRALDILGRILTALPDHAEVAQLQARYTAERETALTRGRAQAAPTPSAAVSTAATHSAKAAPSAPVPAFFADAEETAAASTRPKVTPTSVHLSETFSFADDALDVDALIAASIPERAEGGLGVEDALTALAAPPGPEFVAAMATPGAGEGPGSGAGEHSDPETHYGLGLAYRELGLYAEAAAQFERAQGAPGRAFEAPHQAGLCHLAAQRPEAAVVALTHALEAPALAPAQLLASHHALGLALRLALREADAMHHFGEVARRDPRFRDIATLLRPERPADAEALAVASLVEQSGYAGSGGLRT